MRAPATFLCENCGAHFTIDGSTQTPTCAYCHTQILLPEEVWERFHPKPPPEPPPLPEAARGSKRPLWIALGIALAIASAIAIASFVASRQPRISFYAAAGETCRGRTSTCSLDRGAMLQCGGDDKLALAMACKGPDGCRVSADNDTLSCDETLGDPGDPCERTDGSCSTDHKAELRCQAGRFAVIATCKGPDGCTLTPESGGQLTLSCDDHIADVGDPCFDAERTACSSDHRAFLTCTAQRFAVDHACEGAGGCAVKKNTGTSTVTMTCDTGR